MRLRNNIRTLRKSLRVEGKPVSIEQFADMVGISINTVISWEKQVRNPSDRALVKLQWLFQWEPDQILKIRPLDKEDTDLYHESVLNQSI